MPLDIQLAIQGGGAKIAALMAAMEAIDELQTKGILRVTRIAGTSAGALVGAIYAAGPGKVKEARIRLQSLTAKDIKRIFPSPFAAGNTVRLVKLLLMGSPLWSTREIEKFLAHLMRAESGRFENIHDFNAPSARNIALKIVSTNLSSTRKEVHEGDQPLIPSLLNSAGLPYCFRTWSKNGSPVIVDGGICENLPSDELGQTSDTGKFGKVVGITFTPSAPVPIDSAKSFSIALLETAIQNSMQRARQRLGEGYIHEIDTRIGTFEFEKALACVKEDRGEYELVHSEALNWFRDFAAREKSTASAGNNVLVGDPWSRQSIEIMDKLGRLYHSQYADRPREFIECTLVVRARCLSKPGEDDFGQPDVVKYTGTFKPKSEPIVCQLITVSGTTHGSEIRRTRWSWTDLADKSRVIKAIDLPMRSPGTKPGQDRELLLFLDPPLPPASGPYLFEFEDLIQDFMKPLADGKEDELFFVSKSADGVIQRVDVVLFVPVDTPHLHVRQRNGSPGREMTREELKRYDVPIGYRAMGWSAQQVKGGIEVGMFVSRDTGR